MSRHGQLPPRCPLQKKTVAPQVNAPVSPFSGKDTEFHSRQNVNNKITDESFILEDQLPWLNDLLSDLDLNTESPSHRQTASDSSTLLGALPDLDQLNEKGITDFGEPDDELESSWMYGPNSPRMRINLGFPGNEIASAFPRYVMQHLDGYGSMSGVQSESYRDARAFADEISSDNKLMKRHPHPNPHPHPHPHPGQRTRARKLQYITELERTANVLQNLKSELAVRLDSLIQQHAALSRENNTLKQQLLRMQQKKFIVDNESESLMAQVEMLRTRLAVSSSATTTNKFHSRLCSGDSFTHTDNIWSM